MLKFGKEIFKHQNVNFINREFAVYTNQFRPSVSGIFQRIYHHEREK
jgi:hypothetical protein